MKAAKQIKQTNLPLAEAKARLSAVLDGECGPQVIVTKHGRPAGVIIGFPNEDDYLDWKVSNDPAFRDYVSRSVERSHKGQTISLAAARRAAGV